MNPEESMNAGAGVFPISEEASSSEIERDVERASDSALTEDLALALLKRRDFPAQAVERLSKNAAVTKFRKVKFAIAAHPQAPRRVSLRLIREFYTFDLMQFALSPLAAADLKRATDEILVSRITSITLGERISLARRASGPVAAALLLAKEPRVWQTALENPRLTEVDLVKVLARANAGAALVEAVCHHAKWSPRHEVRMALLRDARTPLACALEFARTLRPAQLRDLLHQSRLPEKIKGYLRKELEERR